MKYDIGDKVRIKSLDWYNQMLSIPTKIVGKDDFVAIECGAHIFTKEMCKFCGRVMTIKDIGIDFYLMDDDVLGYEFTDDMIEGLVEEDVDLIPKFGEFSDNEPLDIPTMTTDFIKEHGLPCPNGYIFKDENGNVINATKIVLEKVNTLKTQSDNMETETHRGYYTTEEETTNKSKKLAWFKFFDSNFADKVELDLSNRELIQEDGKWFVVKKKKEYPKTYAGCCDTLYRNSKHDECYEACLQGHPMQTFARLLICRDAYWKIAGEEMGLGGPWKPDWSKNEKKYTIEFKLDYIHRSMSWVDSCILAFPSEELRDVFYENFKESIEQCKELL